MEPTGIFVYGTLRSDVFPRSKYYNMYDCEAISAYLKGGKMYFDSLYPYIILDNSESIIIGQIIFPKNLKNKIIETDRIENEGIMYKRVIVSVILNDTKETINAYTYIRNYDNKSIEIESGDWALCNKEDLINKSLYSKQINIMSNKN